MLDKAQYLTAFHADTAGLAAAARRGLDAPVPSCPGWTLARLLAHIGPIYISVAKNIRVGKGQDVVNELEDLELAPEFEDWFRGDLTVEAMPPGIAGWFEQSAAELEAVFRGANPEERTWTWYEPDQTVRFWMRRMAHETAVHRWDAQLAHDCTEPIEAELAGDGIDEALTVYQPRWCRPESKRKGSGESYHFHRTDGEGEWLVHFEGDGMQVSREHAKGDVAVRGPASDLLLFLWHRIPGERLDVLGDAALLDRYFELAPPD
jgi:uncharacterized protein (TIGR03083 family)